MQNCILYEDDLSKNCAIHFLKMSSLQSVGKKGEKMALDFLRRTGYSIHETNYRTRLGEIDIIAEKKGIIVFIEVKTRIGDKKGKPYEAITSHKIRHLQKAIQFYINKKKSKMGAMRIDVISIELNPDESIRNLKHFENLDIRG